MSAPDPAEPHLKFDPVPYGSFMSILSSWVDKNNTRISSLEFVILLLHWKQLQQRQRQQKMKQQLQQQQQNKNCKHSQSWQRKPCFFFFEWA